MWITVGVRNAYDTRCSAITRASSAGTISRTITARAPCDTASIATIAPATWNTGSASSADRPSSHRP
jgi:hypothetical protein